MGSTFGSRGTGQGSGTGSAFGGGVGEKLPADTAVKPTESSPNAAGPENSQSTVGIEDTPAPGGFSSTTTDKGGRDARDHAWGSGEAAQNMASKDTGPAEEKEPIMPKATPPREGWFGWADLAKRSLTLAGGPPEDPEYRFVWQGRVGSRPDASWRPTTTN